MKSYIAIKTDLKRAKADSKYFTRGFYNMFVSARSDLMRNIINGVDLSYVKDGVSLTHEYDPVYESDYYNIASGSYCEFLQAFYDGLQEFKVTCYDWKNGYAEILHTCRRRYDDLQEAQAVSAVLWSEYPYVEVEQI